jgi:hypothetical protein
MLRKEACAHRGGRGSTHNPTHFAKPTGMLLLVLTDLTYTVHFVAPSDEHRHPP